MKSQIPFLKNASQSDKGDPLKSHFLNFQQSNVKITLSRSTCLKSVSTPLNVYNLKNILCQNHFHQNSKIQFCPIHQGLFTMVMLKIQILVNLLSPIQGFTDDQSILYLKVK